MSKQPAEEHGYSAKAQREVSRRLDSLEEVEPPTFGMTDADRRKRVRKALHGSIRLCPGCQAISTRKRWRIDPVLYESVLETGRSVERRLCPGCARVDQGRVDGFVELRGPVVAERPAEIKSLVDHIIADARLNDPVHHVASYVLLPDRIALETTSQWLAETIGKAVRRQYRGELRILFSPDEEFVRVYWAEREAGSHTTTGT